MFLRARDRINRAKKQATEQRKRFRAVWDKGLIANMNKEYPQLVARKC